MNLRKNAYFDAMKQDVCNALL